MSGDGILPRTYRMLRISMGEGSKVQSLEPPSGMDWKTREEVTRKIGDAWLTSRKAALARVPSVIAPYTWNYLLNPEHPDAKHVRIAEIIPERFDGRLFRLGGR
jgi:RES domain-containing protein